MKLYLIFFCLTLVSNFSIAAEILDSQFAGKTNMRDAGGNTSELITNFDIYEVFDVNQDGYDDLIFGQSIADPKTFRHHPSEFVKPVVLFWNAGVNKYVVNNKIQKSLPFLHFPRRIHGSINPKNGLTYLFIADTGLDGSHFPNCGGQNHLITFNPSTHEVGNIPLPVVNDYSHGLISSDFNGDQITDYLILNSPFIKASKCAGNKYTNDSYILYSNNKGGFDKKDLQLEYKGWGSKPFYNAGATVKFNNNRYLVLGTESFKSDSAKIYLYKQESNSRFVEISKVDAPSVMRNPTYADIAIFDVDGDGDKEVLAIVAEHMGGWRGRYIQLLDIQNDKLVDQSHQVVQINPKADQNLYSPDWCTRIFYKKISDLKSNALICTTLTPYLQGRNKVYVWDESKLKPLVIQENRIRIEKWSARGIVPVTLNTETVIAGYNLEYKRDIGKDITFDGLSIVLLKLDR